MNTKPQVLGWCASLAVMLAACTPKIHAQEGRRPPTPSAHECRVLANQLNSNPRSEAFRRALGAEIAACGAVGATAISTALRAATGVQDPRFADQFRFMVAYNRSPVVLDALLDVAANPAAATPMRMVAIEGAMRQHRLEMAYGEHGEQRSRPRGICDLSVIDHAGDYDSKVPLPAGSQQMTVLRLRRIAADEATPPTVREAARCAAYLVESSPPTS